MTERIRYAWVVCHTCGGGKYMDRTKCYYCGGSGRVKAELIRVIDEFLAFSGQPGQGGREPLGHCLRPAGRGGGTVSLCGIWCKQPTDECFDPLHKRACKECARLAPK